MPDAVRVQQILARSDPALQAYVATLESANAAQLQRLRDFAENGLDDGIRVLQLQAQLETLQADVQQLRADLAAARAGASTEEVMTTLQQQELDLLKAKGSNLMLYTPAGVQVGQVESQLTRMKLGRFLLHRLPSDKGTTPWKVAFGDQEGRRKLLKEQGDLAKARHAWRVELDLTTLQQQERKLRAPLVKACRERGVRVEWRGIVPYVHKQPAQAWLEQQQQQQPRSAAAAPPPRAPPPAQAPPPPPAPPPAAQPAAAAADAGAPRKRKNRGGRSRAAKAARRAAAAAAGGVPEAPGAPRLRRRGSQAPRAAPAAAHAPSAAPAARQEAPTTAQPSRAEAAGRAGHAPGGARYPPPPPTPRRSHQD